MPSTAMEVSALLLTAKDIVYAFELLLARVLRHLLSQIQVWASFTPPSRLYDSTQSAALSIVFVALLVLPAFAIWKRSRGHQRDLSATRTTLQALLLVVTPTTSLWPASYVTIACQAARTKQQAISLPLTSFIDDIKSGKLELRNAKLDLPDLMLDSIDIKGWRIRLQVQWSWRLVLIRRLVVTQLFSVTSTTFPLHLASAEKESMSDAKTSQPASSDFFRPESTYQHPVLGPNNEAHAQLRMRLSSRPELSPSLCSASHRLAFLDTVPSLKLETYIRELQMPLTPGTCLTLRFTTIGTSISFFSRSFVLAMLPFLSRRSIHGQVTPDVQSHGFHSQFPSRPAFPLLSSLSQVLQLLVSSPTPFSICSVENTSEDYAMLLNDYAQDLGDNPIVRQQFVQRWGMEGWREERLYALWEAAAFNAKFLERWSVTVRK